MNVQSHQAGPVTVVDLDGRFDKLTAPRVTQELEKVTSTIPPCVVVNMTGVNFVDSTGLATLVQGLRRCQQRGGQLYLCGMVPQVYMIFELTRLDKAFMIFADESHAVQAFN